MQTRIPVLAFLLIALTLRAFHLFRTVPDAAAKADKWTSDLGDNRAMVSSR